MAALPLFMALLLAIAATHKLIERQRLATVTMRLAGVPAHFGMPLLLLAATGEALVAIALLVTDLRMGGALGAAAIWSVYALALLRHRGAVLDCGCDLVRREKPVGATAILRPALLALLALIVAALPASPWNAETPFAALALLALWFAAAELAAIPAYVRT